MFLKIQIKLGMQYIECIYAMETVIISCLGLQKKQIWIGSL